ncbi:MAG TPA: XdhC family protein [Blastocatellia bacterium]|nr:XdhC family protein [Blastocatellia bacterium]
MDHGIALKLIQEAADRGESIAVVRLIISGANENKLMVVQDGELVPGPGNPEIVKQILAAVERLEARGGVAELVEAADEQGSPLRIAIEIVRPKLQLVIFGAGHVGQSVALMGALIGYDVIVIDDREEFASRRRLPDPRIELLVSDYASAASKVSISSSTAVVIVTRGHQYDEACLKSVLGSNAIYLGMIGSRRRVLSVFKKLESEGVSERELQRVHAPIGLKIGARSPQEIAVAILAEIIDHVNNPIREQKGERDGL